MTAPAPPLPASAPPHKAWGWAVHLFTASGAVLAVLAVMAIFHERWVEALLWLFLALLIDGVDGSLARAARVREQVPRIDGDTLDLVIDYLSYVFVPTLFLWRAAMLPEPLVVPLAALIQVSSLYVFARRDMKTDDGYFRGFPALWNVIALYIFITGLGDWTTAIIIVLFAVLSFAPVHVVHPFRVRDFGPWLIVISATWAISTCALLLPGLGDNMRGALLAGSAATSLALLAMGLWRTGRGRRAPR